MGGGRKHLLPHHVQDPEYYQLHGERKDGRNLIDEWLTDKVSQGKRAHFVWDQAGFDSIDFRNTDHLLGTK